jgi:RNA polymerase sigma-70 factor (ECF subfamily)
LNESQEAALIRRCQVGDKETFRMLVEQYRNVLFGTAYLIMRDRGLAEDVAQEALVKIWKQLPSLRSPNSAKAWMVRIVVNEVKQQVRKKRVPIASLEQVSEIMGKPNATEMALIRDEERKALKQALDKLPSEQREAIVLRYFSDLTVPEIAGVMNQGEGTIKSRLSRALDRLREILSHDEVWRERR